MTAPALAAFIDSRMGQFYAQVCRRYGQAPGDVLDDDVLAFGLNAGYYMRELQGYAAEHDVVSAPPIPADATPAPRAVVTDLQERMAADLAMRRRSG